MSNMVRTAKYEYYNFLPKFLWEEFNPATKIANVYFLFIAALQASPRWIRVALSSMRICIALLPSSQFLFVATTQTILLIVFR